MPFIVWWCSALAAFVLSCLGPSCSALAAFVPSCVGLSCSALVGFVLSCFGLSCFSLTAEFGFVLFLKGLSPFFAS